jgi:hypothetical protein
VRVARVSLSTCVPGFLESVRAFRLPKNRVFEVIGAHSSAALCVDDATLYLKESMGPVTSCGGIGTWSIPAAQLGASFYVDTGRVVFDPAGERVWIGRR